MNFWEKVTGSNMTKEFNGFEDRAKNLPKDYQELWEKIKENLWKHSDFTGRNLMPVFDSALNMLEETACSGKNAQEVLHNDINEFCSALIGEDVANTFRDKWRKQLNKNIAKKLGK